MKEQEEHSLKCVKIFEKEFFRYIDECHPHLNLLGRIQFNYHCRKILFEDNYKYCVIMIIKDEQLWEEYFYNPRELKGFLVNFCRFLSFECKILKSFQLEDNNDVLTTPCLNIEKRLFHEYFSSILNPRYRNYGGNLHLR
jgi:hypothetical protein